VLARSCFGAQDFLEFVVSGLLGFNFVINLSNFVRNFLVRIFSAQAFLALKFYVMSLVYLKVIIQQAPYKFIEFLAFFFLL